MDSSLPLRRRSVKVPGDLQGIATSTRARAGAESRLTLADDVYLRIASDIVSGRLLPAEKLAFEKLRQRYGFGVSPLREALQRLCGENLVVAEGHVGFRVAPISLADLEDINATRLMLESHALREAILHGDVRWEASIVAVAHQLSRLPIPQDAHDSSADDWEEGHRQLHDTLISACPSRWTLQFCRILFSQFGRYRRIILTRYWKSTPLRSTIDAEHDALVKAVLARDSKTAVSMLAVHYTNSAERVVTEYRRITANQSTHD